ncbi:hypothetical protein SDC9_174467 [bioreactor metagenome]|uniref:Zinc-ribbon domain-containing protein n=1 Tax=bioreactor metagenome TaxID=1076179 RepID=A0A645GLK1_9ZZZZ
MKTQCPHCNQTHNMDDQNNGEIVVCEACKEEFVADPIPVLHRKVTVETATNSNLMFCRDCGKQISRNAAACPNCGARYGCGEDKLSCGIILILWLLLLLPFGGLLVVIVSSALYYTWKNTFPNKAKAVNRMGWLVFLVGIFLWFFLFRMFF